MIAIRKIDPRRLLGVRISLDSPHRKENRSAAGKADTMPRAATRQGAKIGQKGGTKPDARLRAATRHGAKIGQKGGVKTNRV